MECENKWAKPISQYWFKAVKSTGDPLQSKRYNLLTTFSYDLRAVANGISAFKDHHLRKFP